MPQQDSRAVQLAGLAVAGVGLSHFVAPSVFESATSAAFPDNTRQHVYLDGVIETALGLGLIAPQTRKAALVGFLAYGAYLAGNAVRNR